MATRQRKPPRSEPATGGRGGESGRRGRRRALIAVALLACGCGDDGAAVDAALPTSDARAADAQVVDGAAVDAASADASGPADASLADAPSANDATPVDGGNADAIAIDAAVPSGSASFSWTVNQQPASVACPAGATVAVQSTAGPGTAVDQSTACAAGVTLVSGLAPGAWTFRLLLVDGASAATVDNLQVTVAAGETAIAAPVDFPLAPSTGTASVSWTIEGGTRGCPSMAMVEVTLSGANTETSSGDCANLPLIIPSLGPGATTFTLVLTDVFAPENTTTATTNATIVVGETAEPVADFASCSFCPLIL